MLEAHVMADKANTSQRHRSRSHRGRPGRHPQRGAGRAFGRRQDHSRRGAARRRRGADPAGLGRRRHHGVRLRRRRDPASSARWAWRWRSLSHDGVKVNLDRHPRVRRLRRRIARRAAGRRLRAVRRSRPTRASTSRRRRCGRNAARSACRGRWSSPSSTTPGPTTPSALAAAQDAFGDKVLPLYLPAGDGLIGLLSQTHYGTPAADRRPDPDASDADAIEERAAP